MPHVRHRPPSEEAAESSHQPHPWLVACTPTAPRASTVACGAHALTVPVGTLISATPTAERRLPPVTLIARLRQTLEVAAVASRCLVSRCFPSDVLFFRRRNRLAASAEVEERSTGLPTAASASGPARMHLSRYMYSRAYVHTRASDRVSRCVRSACVCFLHALVLVFSPTI